MYTQYFTPTEAFVYAKLENICEILEGIIFLHVFKYLYFAPQYYTIFKNSRVDEVLLLKDLFLNILDLYKICATHLLIENLWSK